MSRNKNRRTSSRRNSSQRRNSSRSRTSSSRDRRKRQRKNDIRISERSSNRRQRSKRRRKERKRVYRRRRIISAIGLFFLIFALGKFAYNKITAYRNYDYPPFRDEVRQALGEEVFVGSTEERSLTTAEKLADLDIVYETISRNYAVSANNRDNFHNFLEDYEKVKKKVLASKTDQEYFDIIMAYINLLENPRTKLVDKEAYDDLLSYYKNQNNTKKSDLIQNPQVVDRYKRMIGEKDGERKTSFEKRNHVLVIHMKDFNLKDIKKDTDEFTKIVNNNPDISKVLVDLSNNQSLDNVYWQKFFPFLSHQDYETKSLVFYRGNMIKDLFEDMKNEGENYSTSFVLNQAGKFPEKIKDIKLDDYMYYDEVSLKIGNNTDIRNLEVHVLTNDSTSNEATNFAKALKEGAQARLIKNSVQSQATANDLVKNIPTDYFILDHSGFLISLDDGFVLNTEDSYLSYDQFINTNEPVEAVLSGI